jgi:hypothetical protein
MPKMVNEHVLVPIYLPDSNPSEQSQIAKKNAPPGETVISLCTSRMRCRRAFIATGFPAPSAGCAPNKGMALLHPCFKNTLKEHEHA